MLVPVSELAEQARALGPQFERRHGPAALLLSPGREETERAAMSLGVIPTVAASPQKNFLDGVLLMLRAFRELSVFFLAPKGTLQEVTLGRSPDCQVVVDDASVSKLHARLMLDGHKWHLRDEGSLNGTFVNGERLGAGPRAITDGDTLAFGDAQLIFITTRTLQAQLVVRGTGTPLRPT